MGWGFGNIGTGGTIGGDPIFGDGSDGAMVISEDTTWTADPEDTGMIVKNFESLTIEEGVTVAAGNRNCGMIIRVKGDCTIAGTLANKLSPKTILDSDGVDFSAYPLSMLMGTTYAGAGGNGGAGGSGYLAGGSGTRSGAPGGAAMTGRYYGGGWGAGAGGGSAGLSNNTVAGGSTSGITTATTATLFAGGARQTAGNVNPRAGTNGGGSGGQQIYRSSYSPIGPTTAGGSGPGGAGGSEAYAAGGGGAGNYGGGVILMFVGGTLVISGQIDCSGSNGGAGGAGRGGTITSSSGTTEYRYVCGAGGAGGGGGGGRIYIVHRGELTNTGVLNVNGGTGGNAGGIGTTNVLTLDEYKEQEVA